MKYLFVLLIFLTHTALGQELKQKYPLCAEPGNNLILDKKTPYKNCFLELRFNVSGHKFLKEGDADEVVYKINLDNFPLDGSAQIIWPSGVKYFGSIKSGLPFGKGELFFPSEWPIASYTGEFSNVVSKSFSSSEDWNQIYDSSFPEILNFTYETLPDNTRNIFFPYLMEFSATLINGEGEYIFRDGAKASGFFENGVKINENIQKQGQLLEREQAQRSSKISIQAATTNPDSNGTVIITVRTNTDTSSLKINGNEEGSKPDGNYTIKRVARVSQDTEYTIVATDVFGNTASTTITVARQAASAPSNQVPFLKPENIKRVPTRDAVAIIIGIQNYKRVPKAEFANNDAKEFYEYAIRGLGIKPENIKLLLDEEADEVNIVKAFRNWLPLQVTKNKTDVYVFYSGHGLPAPDGKSLYFLPHGVDEELLDRTAVGQNEIVTALISAIPKSVTMFIDACYSGKARGGETLLASAKPMALKADANAFPLNFTVITASANDQISSSSPELKHGIFSFYLMKGMEGDADGNKDGKITAGEMQEYLSDKVSRQAMSMSRKQDTQLVGDPSRVLVGQK